MILFNDLSIAELDFLDTNIPLKDYFYDLLSNIKNNNKIEIILCKNSYERKFVHLLASSIGLYHSRHCDWSEEFKRHRDYQEKIYKIDGQEHYKIIGVKVSSAPLQLSKKDKIHQKCNFKSLDVKQKIKNI